MKILYYSPNPGLNLQDLSGYGTHMREMIAAFRKLGHEVLPVIAGGTEKKITSPVSRKSPKRILKKLIPEIFWETAKDFLLLKKDMQLQKILAQQIEKYQPDLIYERGSYLQLSGVVAARKKNVRHFIELNAPLTEEKKMLQGQSVFANKSDKIEKKIISSADKIFIVSSGLKDYFMKKYNGDKKKFTVTPNAVNMNTIKHDVQSVNKISEKYALPGKTVVGFVGSIFKYHGVDILLNAFSRVLAKSKNSILLIVGDGEISDNLKQQARKKNISEKVIFTGSIPRSEVFNYIRLFDIAVLPQTKEYMSPVKIFEYGAMGKAIIAHDVASVRDVMINNEHGILVNSDEWEMSDAILKLINNVDLRIQIGNNFQKKVISEHTWEKMAKKILKEV